MRRKRNDCRSPATTDLQAACANGPVGEMDLDFSGKAALVTGSTRGIGLACAQLLARRGARVAISSRKADVCEQVAANLRSEGCDAVAIPAHAARDDDLARLVSGTVEAFGTLDIAVACAGINPSFDPLTDLSEASWAKVLDTNLSGPLRLARHALPAMGPGGAMVAVSSVNAGFAMPGSGAYGISKAALEQMVRQLAVEWGPHGIRVNAVSPGTTDTDMIRALKQRPGFIDRITADTPLGRIADSADIAHAIAFFASDHAAHVTGQVLVVDGGQTIMRGTYPENTKTGEE
ncbi:SDR family NAD(P)-dependent oxidoreductase [Croceicoccus mobilis]|uniref:Dehydrogenase n=1 Tax=Croceicoccus mobilis TaxID=1703339 RepID=A0A916Z8X7_9SPHN|nr:SDR family oxidoreductase [Croceicoccus mobilis]GGD80767.1 dehydrogenase [Croceicoccus mobilis]